jgi:hypothetical protein
VHLGLPGWGARRAHVVMHWWHAAGRAWFQNCLQCLHAILMGGTGGGRYKKKNGLKSNLVKMYVERIVDDPRAILAADAGETGFSCPSCGSKFARDALIHGRPALKLAGGKVRMSK